MINFFKFFTFLFIVSVANCDVNNYVCTTDFCESYVDLTGCDALSNACRVQNSTLNGRIFPSTTACSCCQTCLTNLHLGEYCSLGQPGSMVPTDACGPGLFCVLLDGADHSTCEPMDNTPCYIAKNEFDVARENGEMGHLMQRPSCNGDGDYNPITCIPGQLCYCLDKEGKRIFGDSNDMSHAEILLHCGCSRVESTLKTIIESRYPLFSARCDSRGSFDPLQCFDDQCVCVDIVSGSPVSTVFNMTLGLSAMPCFNRTMHQNTTYLRECETKKMERIQEILEYEDEGFTILDFEYNICQPDGFYERVQETVDNKFCSDPSGNQIEDFTWPKYEIEALTMNCNCARTRLLMKESNLIEMPTCCVNGNYQKINCRRGECYCIDKNGQQASVEVNEDDISTLSCYTTSDDFCDYTL